MVACALIDGPVALLCFSGSGIYRLDAARRRSLLRDRERDDLGVGVGVRHRPAARDPRTARSRPPSPPPGGQHRADRQRLARLRPAPSRRPRRETPSRARRSPSRSRTSTWRGALAAHDEAQAVARAQHRRRLDRVLDAAAPEVHLQPRRLGARGAAHAGVRLAGRDPARAGARPGTRARPAARRCPSRSARASTSRSRSPASRCCRCGRAAAPDRRWRAAAG